MVKTTNQYIYNIYNMQYNVFTYIHTYIHTCIHAYMHTCIHTYIHTYIYIYIHNICEWGHSKNTIPIPHIHSRLPAGQGTAKPLILWLKTPNCRSTLKVGNAEAAFRLIIGFVDQLQIYPKEHPIHRLSAVAVSHGAYVRVPADLTINGWRG